MRQNSLDWNKPLLLRHRTTRQERWSNCASVVWTIACELPPPAKGALLLMLLVLVTLLAGCGAISMPSSEAARNPSIPPTTLSEQSQSYSQAALANIQAWRQKLIELLPK